MYVTSGLRKAPWACLVLYLAAVLFSTTSLSAPLVERADLTASLNGSPAFFGGGTYPRATRLADGSLLGSFTAFSNGENIINTCKSTDNGASWTQLGTVTSGVGDIDNAFLLQLPTGRVLAAFRNHSKDPSGAYTFFRITVCYSDDMGASWTYLSQPVGDPGPANGDWEPFMRLSAVDGNTVQLYWSHENSGADQDTLLTRSTDGGLTWSGPTTVSGGGITARDGMSSVAQLPNAGPGDLICVFESDDTSPGGTNLFTLGAVTSSDDGASWGNRHTIYVPTGSGNNAGAPQVVLVGSTLTVSFMTDEDTSDHSWTNGADVKLITSGDGASFGNKITVFPVQTNWAGQVPLSGTSVLVMGDNNGAKAQNVQLS